MAKKANDNPPSSKNPLAPRKNNANEPPNKRTKNGATRHRSAGVPTEPVSVTLADPEVLDCPVCLDPLHTPVYQCENAHITCASCCTKMSNTCPYCFCPTGVNRCRAIEVVVESVRIACRNKAHGCGETLVYSAKLAHEKTCNYTTCSCPLPSCDYVGLRQSLNQHFWNLHLRSSDRANLSNPVAVLFTEQRKHAFLQEAKEKTIFVVTRCVETCGSLVNLVCIGPASTQSAFMYKVKATKGESSIELTARMEGIPKWTGQLPTTVYLLVPNDFVGENGQLRLEICIWK